MASARPGREVRVKDCFEDVDAEKNVSGASNQLVDVDKYHFLDVNCKWTGKPVVDYFDVEFCRHEETGCVD